MHKISPLLLLSLLVFSSCKNQNTSTRISPATTVDSITQHQDTISLLFVGDIMQHKAQLTAAKTPKAYDYSSYFSLIKTEIQAADLAVANLETPIGVKPYSGYPQFSAPAELAQATKDAGFDLLLTANNHSVDRYAKGIQRTLDILDSLDIPHLGTYRNEEERAEHHPYLIQIKGKKLAFLNYTYGTNGLPVPPPYVVNLTDTISIKKDLEKAKEQGADLTFVCMHWGVEYDTRPSVQQQQLAKWLISSGADHIIGGHPHVIQPIETVEDSIRQTKHHIVYSLGNFISNMSKKDTDGGLVVKIELFETNQKQDSKVSYALVWTGRPILTKEKNFKLYPISFERDSLNSISRNKLILFEQRANKVLEHNSKGIEKFNFK